MPASTARVKTPRSAHHAQRLADQPSLGVSAAVTRDGRVTLSYPDGTCVLAPIGEKLDVIATALTPKGLTAIQLDVTERLTEEKLTLDWSDPVNGQDIKITDPLIGDYLITHCTPPDEILQDLATETREATGGDAEMQISHDEGAFLTMLTRLTGARRAVEVGVFTGYSSLCIARGLPADGHLLACDISEEWTSRAKPYWERAGVADRIELKIGPALETLRALPLEENLDIAFIDADKISYPLYYEELVQRLRPGGLIVLDNVFLAGRALDPACVEPDLEPDHIAIRELNDKIAAAPRVESVMLPIRDGVTLARKV